MSKLFPNQLEEQDLVVGNYFHKRNLIRGARLLYKIVKVTKKAVYADHYLQDWHNETKIVKWSDKPKRFNKVDIINVASYVKVENAEDLREV